MRVERTGTFGPVLFLKRNCGKAGTDFFRILDRIAFLKF